MATLLLPIGYFGYPEDQLRAHVEESERWLKSLGMDVIAAPVVITMKDCDAVVEAAKKGNWDAVIVLITSWVEPPHVTRILSEADLEHKPMLLWAHDNIWDASEKATISFGTIASAAVMRETFEEFEYHFKFVTGNPGNQKLGKEILDFAAATRAIYALKRERLGMLGYASMGMYTGLGDHIKVKKLLGTEVVHIDNYSLLAHLDEGDPKAIADAKNELKEQWKIADGISEDLLTKMSAIYVRLKDLVEEHQLGALTAKCQYEMSIDFGLTPCVALSLLGERMPVSCEGDVYLLLSQMILSHIAQKTTTYGDILAFLEDGIISAACGFAPKSFLKEERPNIGQHTALYSGMLITSSFKPQDVTVIRIANDKAGFKMHVLEGRTEELKDFHEIGCPAYAGAVIKFDGKNVEAFKQEIMSQHYAIVPGHHGDALLDFCRLMDIRIV